MFHSFHKKLAGLLILMRCINKLYLLYSAYQICRIYLDLWGHACKKWVWPTFGCKVGQSHPIVMKFEADMSCHLLNVYTKFQIDAPKHVGKSPENSEEWTADRHCHGMIWPFSKWTYKNVNWIFATSDIISRFGNFRMSMTYWSIEKLIQGLITL